MRRRAAGVILLIVIGVLSRHPVVPAATAQLLVPPGYVVLPSGWNLFSAAGASTLNVPSAVDTLYSLQPGAQTYGTVGWSGLSPGFGYWAYLSANTAVRLPSSSETSYGVDVPPSAWVMVGNPSTVGSARVSGADLVRLYSPLSGYRDDTLIPVGYGAFVLAYNGGRVSIDVVQGDVTSIDYPSCCTEGSGDFGGRARIDIADDSPYGLLYGVRAVAPDGRFPPAVGGNYAYGLVAACSACTEYAAAPSSCGTNATVRTVDVAPGQFLIHLTADGPRVPDIILLVPLQANTRYFFCRWIAAVRQ